MLYTLFTCLSLGTLEILLDIDTHLIAIGGIIIENLLIHLSLSLEILKFAEHCSLLEQERGSIGRIIVRNLHSLLETIESILILLEVNVAVTPETAITLLRTPLTGYWASHYTFSTPSADSEQTSVAMSRNAAIILVINVAVPLLIAYGTRHGDEPMTRRAFEWLQQLPPESNSIISRFATAGIRSRDAFTTQALIQLRRRYCETHSCLYCRIGHRLLTARAQR